MRDEGAIRHQNEGMRSRALCQLVMFLMAIALTITGCATQPVFMPGSGG